MESSNSLWSAQHHQSHHKLHLLSMFSTVSPSTAAKLWIGLVRFIFVPFWTTALKQFWTVSQMPLESHSAEAKCLITAFLESVLHQLPHWYSPMLPEDHPSSICHLLGLRSVECNLVLKSFGTLKMRGQTDKQHLTKMPSNYTYRNTPCLLPLKQIQVLINHWLPRNTQSYWIAWWCDSCAILQWPNQQQPFVTACHWDQCSPNCPESLSQEACMRNYSWVWWY
jgi:hypothetical protein